MARINLYQNESLEGIVDDDCLVIDGGTKGTRTLKVSDIISLINGKADEATSLSFVYAVPDVIQSLPDNTVNVKDATDPNVIYLYMEANVVKGLIIAATDNYAHTQSQYYFAPDGKFRYRQRAIGGTWPSRFSALLDEMVFYKIAKASSVTDPDREVLLADATDPNTLYNYEGQGLILPAVSSTTQTQYYFAEDGILRYRTRKKVNGNWESWPTKFNMVINQDILGINLNPYLSPQNKLDKYFVKTCIDKSKVKLDKYSCILGFGDSIMATSDGGSWLDILKTKAGYSTHYNYAVGNAHFSNNSYGGARLITRLNAFFTDVDNQTINASTINLIIVACGTNDAKNGTPINTFKTDVNEFFTSLKNGFTSRSIECPPVLVITPIRRGTEEEINAVSDNNLEIKVAKYGAILNNLALQAGFSVLNGFDIPVLVDDMDINVGSNTATIASFMYDDNLHVHPNSTTGRTAYAQAVITAIGYDEITDFLDDTMSVTGKAADAKAVGDALYHASKSDSIETKCPLRYITWSAMKSEVGDEGTIVDMAPNTCAFTGIIENAEKRDSLNSFLGEAFISKYGNTAINIGFSYIISRSTLYHNSAWSITYDLYSVVGTTDSMQNCWSATKSTAGDIRWDNFTPTKVLPRIVDVSRSYKNVLENYGDIRYNLSKVDSLQTYGITKPQEMLDGSYVTMNGVNMAQFLNGNLPASDLETADTSWTLKKIRFSKETVQFQLKSFHGTYIYLGAWAYNSPDSISWTENLVNKWTRYDITYNIESSPNITTDVNNFLSAIVSSYDSQTGKPVYSTEDRSADIATMLSQTGCCILGPGVFYVSGVELPKSTFIKGQGNATKVIWKDAETSSNYVFKLNTDCAISDLRILGNSEYYTPSENIGPVSGILMEGTFMDLDDAHGPKRCHLSNVYVGSGFGCGIKLQHTGTGVDSNVKMVNCTIQNCDCGIYNGTFSEFNMFTNVGCNRNYYGAISKGGNNRFVNCDFSYNEIGAYLDCTGEPNNSHGMFSACEFAHNGRVVFEKNKGYSIVCKGVTNGERFEGCTIGYGSIDISDSTSIKFCNCGIGRQQRAIRLSDTNNIQFAGCSFGEGTTISVPEGKTNTNMHVIDSFYFDGTPFVVE